MSLFSSFRRTVKLLRSPERDIIASIVDDPLKVQREVRFLLLRLLVFVALALTIIISSILFIRRGVAGIDEHRLLQQELYNRFESMARLSHDVGEGRAALEKIRTLFPKDDNLLPFLKALEALAKETGNRAQFRFDGIPVEAPGMSPYRFVGYTITLEGDSHSFLRYLASFSSLPYLVVLESITMQGEASIHTHSVLYIKGKLYVQ